MHFDPDQFDPKQIDPDQVSSVNGALDSSIIYVVKAFSLKVLLK